MTHLTRDELIQWRDEGAAADRDRVVGHLAVCDECGARYAEIIRTRPVEHAAVVLRPADFVARGYKAYAGPARRPEGPASWLRDWRPLTVAAAGIVVVGVAIFGPSAWRHVQPLESDVERATIRGGSLVAVMPAGRLTAAPSAFEWHSPIEAARYRVDVFDPRQQLILSMRATGDRLVLTSELRDRLTPGTRYAWKVIALDEAGTVLSESGLETFEVTRTR
ncbi:MAG: hypothetical protein HYS05_09385 [Acidobacteria bacterium]|nr:hypothetical protein [Acidobacteriota bacterium]